MGGAKKKLPSLIKHSSKIKTPKTMKWILLYAGKANLKFDILQ